MAETIVIESRFNGPPESAHGGYISGLLARQVGAKRAEVTLRAPPPLDVELQLREAEAGLRLFDGETLVAAVRPIDSLELEVPDPVGIEEAEAAREGSPLHEMSPYPDCFVCGPRRQAPDGLRVIAGPVAGREDVIASPWEVDETLPVIDGSVAPELIWSALDCPGGCSLMLRPGIGMVMLGRMTAQLFAPVAPGTTHVAIGWPIEHDRRKHLSGAAVFSAEGELLAVAKGLWIEPRRAV